MEDSRLLADLVKVIGLTKSTAFKLCGSQEFSVFSKKSLMRFSPVSIIL